MLFRKLYLAYLSFPLTRRIMTKHILCPDDSVKGMKILDKKKFEKPITVPSLLVKKDLVSKLTFIMKKYFLKLENFKAIQSCDSGNVIIFLNPEVVQGWNSFTDEDSTHLSSLGLSPDNMKMRDLVLSYENYSHDNILKAVLPDDIEGFSSFTIIGHILHVNLRDHLVPYKKLIGEVLLEKIKNCRTVVNKVDMIENTYRNFQMEILAGEDDVKTCVKENGCTFEFDFSTVYWNSRLCTEHERIIKIVKKGDLFIDVFAGVGPFSIPIAKKLCYVHANDLNPESYSWMEHNVKLNKIKKDYITTYNKDGKDFIIHDVKNILLENLNKKNIHIAMNLPALAVEFLPYFIGLLKDNHTNIEMKPILYVYCFIKGSETSFNYDLLAIDLVCKYFGRDIKDKIFDVFDVRTVSNFKKMMRVTLHLDEDVLFNSSGYLKRKLELEMQQSSKNLKSNNGKEKN